MGKIYIEMTLNKPSVEIDGLVSLFMRYGCPMGIGQHLAKDLVANGRRKMSVLSSLDLKALDKDLSRMSITLRVLSKLKKGRRHFHRRRK